MWFHPSVLEGRVCVGIAVVLPFCWSVWFFVIVLLSGLGISVFLLCGIVVVWGLCVVHVCIPAVCMGI